MSVQHVDTTSFGQAYGDCEVVRVVVIFFLAIVTTILTFLSAYDTKNDELDEGKRWIVQLIFSRKRGFK